MTEAKPQEKEAKMRYIGSFGLAIVSIIVSLAIVGCQNKGQVKEQVTNEPEHSFEEAHKKFIESKYKDAADAIRRASESLKSAAENATQEGRKALNDSIDGLQQIAGEVERGEVKSVKKLEDAFSQTYQALAKSQQLKATETWTKKQSEEAGKALQKATENLERARKWAGEEYDESAQAVVENSRKVAEELRKGTDSLASEVAETIDTFGKEIDRLGDRIKEGAK
jgi:ABC-type transporter Mla subunit MlaD